MIQEFIKLDTDILLWFQKTFINDYLTSIFIFFTDIGYAGLIWLAISIILLVKKDTRSIGKMCLISFFLTLIIVDFGMKSVFARERPYDVISQVQLLIGRQLQYSFPSGHSSLSFSVAVVIFKELPRKFGIPALILATLISISRIYLGVHYPSDVIFGALFGSIIAILTCIYYNNHKLLNIKQQSENL